MSDEENKSITISENFSRRDREKFDSEKKIPSSLYNLDKLSILLFLLTIIFFVLFSVLIIKSGLDFGDKDNMRYLLSSSSQTLGTILGLSLTIMLIFVQININRYGAKIYLFLMKNKIVLVYFLYTLLVIVLSINAIAFVGRTNPFILDLSIISIQLEVPELFFGLLLMITSSFLFLPLFIYNLIGSLKITKYLNWLYAILIKSIKNKNVVEVENNLSILLSITQNGIQERNRDVIKEGIEALHDLFKYCINNEEEINDLFSLKNEKGVFNYSQDWIFTEILSGYSSFFKLMIDSSQYKSARFLIAALRSCGTESLHDFGNSYGVRKQVLNTYKSFVDKAMDEISVENMPTEEIYQFFRHSFLLGKNEFYYFLSHLFDERFYIKIIKNKPHIISSILQYYFYGVQRVTYKDRGDNSENIVILIERMQDIVFVSKKIKKMGEFPSKLIEYFNDMNNESISNMAYLLSLYLLSEGKVKEAKRTKKLLKKIMSNKEMVEKSKKVLDKDYIRSSEINLLAHRIFRKYKEDESYFDLNDFKKLAKKFSKL